MEEEAAVAIRALRSKRRQDEDIRQKMESLNCILKKEHEDRKQRSEIAVTLPFGQNDEERQFYQAILSVPPKNAQQYVPRRSFSKDEDEDFDWSSSDNDGQARDEKNYKNELFQHQDIDKVLLEEEDSIAIEKETTSIQLQSQQQKINSKKTRTVRKEQKDRPAFCLSDFSDDDDDFNFDDPHISSQEETGGYLSDDTRCEEEHLHCIGLAAKAPPIRRRSQRDRTERLELSDFSSSSYSLPTRRRFTKGEKNLHSSSTVLNSTTTESSSSATTLPAAAATVLDFTPGQRLRVRPSRRRRPRAGIVT